MLFLFGTLAFVFEVTAWVALARWGWQRHPALGLLFPLAFMVFWGAFLSPKASYPLPPLSRASLQVLLFAIAAWGAARVWSVPIAIIFFCAAVVTILAALSLGLLQGEPA